MSRWPTELDDSTTGGVVIHGGASGNRIGTDGLSVDDAGQGNVISGNVGSGVVLDGSSDNVVAGNSIGTDATGSVSLPNQPGGIRIVDGSSDNTIGGTTAVAGNLITDNGGPGVVVGAITSDVSVGNQITGNRIFANTGQAIDLGDDGVTDNCTSPRQGPNNLQNFPIIVTDRRRSDSKAGWAGSTPDTTFRIDFFASAAYGPGGSGEAEDYLGSLEVTTDASGQAVFDVPFAAPAGLPIITPRPPTPRATPRKSRPFVRRPSKVPNDRPRGSLTGQTTVDLGRVGTRSPCVTPTPDRSTRCGT